MTKKLMLYDPQTGTDPIILCFKNSDNYNEVNGDQFVCDIPLKTAIQIYNYYYARYNSDIEIDDDVIQYLRDEIKKNSES